MTSAFSDDTWQYQCRVLTQSARLCGRAANDELAGIPLCPQHRGMLLDAALRTIRSADAHPDVRPQVYFAEREGWIKIGFTNSLQDRIRSLAYDTGILRPEGMTLGPCKLLAWMYGDEALERRVHRYFADDRVVGEWFERSPRLVAYIGQVVTAPDGVPPTLWEVA